MTTTIERKFETRRDAELAVERLVQEHGFERTDVFISAEGDQNTAGEERSGGDSDTALEAGRDDAPLSGPISVSVDVNDDALATVVTQVFDEISGG